MILFQELFDIGLEIGVALVSSHIGKQVSDLLVVKLNVADTECVREFILFK
jgi:hypothetical protein